ncbi:MAG: hypothetical protein GXO68_03825 [Crenarchaeota archaeon]|nr:hypothetical protein [Thermoproteota archaeon]
MKKVIAVLILFIMVTASFTQLAWVSKAQGENQAIRMTADFNLIAVVEGKEEGVLIPATLTLTYPGNGTVVVKAGGEVGDITVKSTMQAIKLASLLSGVDWRQWNYNLTIHTDSGIDGPSGSVMITFVTYTLLSGAPTGQGFNGFVVTGAISPDGLASSVGGVEYKCRTTEAQGLTFYYPLVNYTIKLAQACNGHRYTGILNLTAQVFNIVEPPLSKPPFTLPVAFNQTMKAAANRMINEAKELVNEARRLGMTDETLSTIQKTINESKRFLEKHPYAAASLAFTALNEAYAAYFTARTLNQSYSLAKEYLDGVASNVSKELDRLEQVLESLPRNGSIYYVEFVATAYTRLAAAKSSLLAYHNYSDSPTTLYDRAIYELSHAAARVTSIEEWIRSANATRDEKPLVSSTDIERLAWILKDYSTTSSEYASTLAQYAVKYYGRSKSILVYIDVLDSIRKAADSYMSQSNYLAAIGFYRELLSKSLDVMFQASIQAYRGPGTVIPQYSEELNRMYNTLVTRLLTRGLTPGLAPAYYDYSLVMKSLNQTSTSLLLLDEAVVSALVWDMLTITLSSINQTSQIVTSEGPGGFQASQAILMVIIVGLFAFVIGYLSSVKGVAKILRQMY